MPIPNTMLAATCHPHAISTYYTKLFAAYTLCSPILLVDASGNWGKLEATPAQTLARHFLLRRTAAFHSQALTQSTLLPTFKLSKTSSATNQLSPATMTGSGDKTYMDTAKETLSSVQQKASETVGQVQDTLTGSAKTAQDKAGDYTQAAKDKAGDLTGSTKDTAGQTQDKAGDYAQTAKDKASSAADTLGSKAQETKDQAGSKIEQAKK